MKGEKQLFGRNGNIASQKHQETQLRVTDSGRIIFPSQEKIFGQLDHILGVFKNSLNAQPYREILLTTTGHDFYRLARHDDGRVEMRLLHGPATGARQEEAAESGVRGN